MKQMKNQLITVPTFLFTQVDKEGMTQEDPIQVIYYNGTLELTQGEDSVLISPEFINDLFKQIQRNLSEAEEWLNRNTK